MKKKKKTILQIKPNRWSCSITSLAMCLDTTVERLCTELGHDGSQIIFPELKEPSCRRGFHSQELIHLAWNHGFCVTPFELFPAIRPFINDYQPEVVEFIDNWHRFIMIIKNEIGILEGKGHRCHHAVHFHHGMIYDPDGQQYEYSKEACEERGFYGNRALVFTTRITT